MKYIYAIILAAFFISCNSNYNEYDEKNDMYNILSQEFGSETEFIKKNIDELLNSNKIDSVDRIKANKVDKIVNEFANYLFELEIELISMSGSFDSPFFDGEKTSEIGLEYLEKNNFYRKQLSSLILEMDLNEYLNDKLRNFSPQNRQGERIEHMKYYFYKIPKEGTIAYLNYKRKTLYEIELKFIYNLILAE